MKKFSANSTCPCGSGKKYKKRCGLFHKGVSPKNALELMKSRFSAYALGDIKYIIETSLDKNLDEAELKRFSKYCEFVNLKILEFTDAMSESCVTFRATIFCEKTDSSFTEKSRFLKIDGKWLYSDGEIINERDI